MNPWRLAIFWLEYLHRLLDLLEPTRRLENKGANELSSKEAYRILQVAEDACPEVIKAAYRALAMKYHPDRGGSVEAMKQLNDAYARLMREFED